MIEPYVTRPRSVSMRGSLRGGLPGIYRDGKFGMLFVQSCEELLDPVVCLLDSLPAHFDPELAPADLLTLVASWLGLDLDDVPTVERRREIVRRAPELARRRGTCRGLELLLELCFPGLGLRVHDGGGTSWSAEPDVPPPSTAMFEVEAPRPLAPDERAAIERLIARVKPAHVAHRLVGAPEPEGAQR